MSDFASLKGKVALVTGSATGIGAACARELACAGAKLMITDIDLAGSKKLSEELNSEGNTTFFSQLEVSDERAWQRVISETVMKCGGLDVLVNNAGIYTGGLLVDNPLEAVRRVHQINIDSVFLGMKYAAAAMQPSGSAGNGGSIINLSSVAGLIGVPGHSAYGSTKGAVKSYSKHAAVEFAKLGYGVRVNSVHPGLIDTNMGAKVFDDFVDIGLAPNLDDAEQAVLQMIPMAKFGQVQDVANMVRFLASDEAQYCTGAEFVVDGGMTAS